ncbi:MAG: hypothetical protein AAF567_03770 [Actinomycetota bacterium]
MHRSGDPNRATRRSTTLRATIAYAILAVLATSLLLIATSACGDGGAEFSANCTLRPSPLGPFGDDTALGSSLSEPEALARMAATGYESWIEIEAGGSWEVGWNVATEELGPAIHTDLAWLDVSGRISGLYEPGEALTFEPIRVSRSFQGKIETADTTSIYVGVAPGQRPDLTADCTISAVSVGTPGNAQLLDVLDVVAVLP